MFFCGSLGACGLIFSPLGGKEIVPLALVKLGTLLSIDEISVPLRYERAFVERYLSILGSRSSRGERATVTDAFQLALAVRELFFA